MALSKQEQDRRWNLYREIVERAWADPAFLEELRRDTEGVLAREIKAAGLDIPVDHIRLVEDTDKLRYFSIGPKEGGWPTC
jgi:hypothetical protein